MADVEISVGSDYPLNGSITNFEAYMFVTTNKFIAEHKDVWDGVVVAGGRGRISSGDWTQLDVRKNMLTLFNTELKKVIKNFPKPDSISCCLIDTQEDMSDKAAIQECLSYLKRVQRLFVQWCTQNDRVGACVPHILQDGRYLHLHLLYNRSRGKHDEFQTWLMQQAD